MVAYNKLMNQIRHDINQIRHAVNPINIEKSITMGSYLFSPKFG